MRKIFRPRFCGQVLGTPLARMTPDQWAQARREARRLALAARRREMAGDRQAVSVR